MAKADNQTLQTASWPDPSLWDAPAKLPTRFGIKTERAYTFLALAQARRTALHIPEFDLAWDRYIILSDTHKGDRSRGADEFQINDDLYCHALEHYLTGDYRLVLNGDIEEGWKSPYQTIIDAYDSSAFQWEREFARRSPRHYLRTWGNHDMDWRDPAMVKRYLHAALRRPVDVHPAVMLGDQIMIAHGHQGEFNADQLAWFSRRVVRYLWRPIQRLLGITPRRTARNNDHSRARDRHLAAWSQANRLLLIAGHTHIPLMGTLNDAHSGNGDQPTHYINDGCCVHKNSITGVEIDRGEIRLVKWASTRVNGSPALFRRTVFRRADLGATLARL